jgi:hypothetical protein
MKQVLVGQFESSKDRLKKDPNKGEKRKKRHLIKKIKDRIVGEKSLNSEI